MTTTDVVTACKDCRFSIYQRPDGTWHLVYTEQADTTSCLHQPQLCTADPAHGPAAVEWSTERLCWPCADEAIDLMAKTCKMPIPDQPPEWEAAVAGRCSHGGHGWDGETCSDIPCPDALADDVAALFLDHAGGDPDLARALVLAYFYLQSDEARDAAAERWHEGHYQPGVSDPAETSEGGYDAEVFAQAADDYAAIERGEL